MIVRRLGEPIRTVLTPHQMREMLAARWMLADTLTHGPVPVPECIERCRELMSTHGVEIPGVCTALGLFFAMARRFDEAREMAERARWILEERMRVKRLLKFVAVHRGAIERLTGDLAAVVAGHPFGRDTSRSHVVFLADEPAREAADRLAAADHAPDRAELAGKHVYVQYAKGVQHARLSAARLERLLDVPGTHRNWRTVAALAELAAA